MKAVFHLLLFLCFYAKGQQPLFNNQKHFKVEDGLPQSFVNSIIQDRDGFIWIGTRDGLARYDGRSFQTFRPTNNDTNSIASGLVRKIRKGPGHHFFIHYENSLFDVFDPLAQFVSKRSQVNWINTLGFHDVRSLFTDNSNRWWLKIKDSTVLMADPVKKEFVAYSSEKANLNSSKTLGITQGKDGRIYVMSLNGVSMIDAGKKMATLTPFPFPFRYFASSMLFNYAHCIMPDGRLAMGDVNRIILFDGASKIFTTIPLPFATAKDSFFIKHMQMGADGKLYFECNSSIYRQETDDSFTPVWTYPGQGPAKDIYSFLIDRTNVMWIGTNANGLFRVNLNSLPLLAAPYINNFHTDVLNKIPGYGIAAKPAGWAQSEWSYEFRYHYTEKGVLYCSYENPLNEPVTLMKFENNIWSKVNVPNSINGSVRGITSFHDTIYAISTNGTIWKWVNALAVPQKISLANQKLLEVIDIETDGKFLLVITQKDGIYKYLQDSLVAWYPVTDLARSTIPFVINQLTDIYRDPVKKGRFWIGTLGQGLLEWDIDKGYISSISDANGLPNSTIYAIETDTRHNLWVSTNKGLCVIDPVTRKTMDFSTAGDIPGNEYNRFHVFKYPDGKLAFGGLEGYTVFDPALFLPDTSDTKVAFTALSVNNQIQRSGSSEWLDTTLNDLSLLELSYRENYLSISFAGMAFNDPDRIRYRYMLHGYDNDWKDNGDGMTAIYTGLPPGHYTFMVNASNTSGKWSRHIKSLRIHISPPFWATWWAYTLYVMLALAIVSTYWKFRDKRLRLSNEVIMEHNKTLQLQEMDTLKTRFFDNITHELRTPLTLILTPLGRMMHQADLPSPYQKNVEYAWANANRLLLIVNQMLDISKTENGLMNVTLAAGNLEEYVQQCVAAFENEADKQEITLFCHTERAKGMYRFDADKWSKIIFNLLSNALKFTPVGGSVTVQLEALPEKEDKGIPISLTVTDTGGGIPATALPHIFDRFFMVDNTAVCKQTGTGIGLSLVKDLVQLMGGSILAESKPGSGTVFTVVLPLTKAVAAEGIDPETLSTNIPKIIPTHEAPLIVVVEDNEELRQFLIESLHQQYRVEAAANGEDALKMILAEMPDLVISDVMMPEMGGYELCQQVKTDDRINHIPLMLLTARAAQDSRLEGLRAGADDYLAKPFHFDELELKIANLLLLQERTRKHLLQQALPGEPPQKVPDHTNPFIQELYAQLDQMIGNTTVDVDALAAAMAMSRRTLGRKLKTLLDIAPNELIRRYRLQKAATLLAAGNPATQVAFTVGFESPSYFSQCFKEQYDITPSDYIRKMSA